MDRLRGAFTIVSVIITMTIIFIAIAEGAGRYVVRYFKSHPDVVVVNYSEENIRKLYDTTDPDYYAEVIREGWGHGVSVGYEPFVEFFTVPYRGRHVTVAEQGFRTTPDGPQDLDVPGPRVFVFGGSTGFGLGVSDRETIAHQMEVLLRESGLDDVSVFNFSVVGYYSSQERILFERLINQGHVPDAAVFIDGLNDFLFCDIPDRTGMSDKIEKLFTGPSRVTFLQTLKRRSNIVKIINHVTGKRRIDPRPQGYCSNMIDNVIPIIRRLNSNRRMIAAVARAHGIVPVFVQQPVTSFGYDKTRYPVRIDGKPAIEISPIISHGYEKIQEIKAGGRMFSDNVLWLEKEEIAENQYIDSVHYSPRYNRHLASRIVDFLRPRLSTAETAPPRDATGEPI